MPTVRYTADGGSYLDADGDRAGPDDPVLEVTDEKAEELVEQFGFEHVDGDGDGVSEEDPLEGKPVAETDVSDHLDRWLDQHYTDRAEQVHAGDADGSLDEVEEAETSETVIDAVQERRDELEA